MAGFGNFGRGGRVPDPVKDALLSNRRSLWAIFAFSGAISLLVLTTSLYMLEVFDRVLTSRSQETLLLLTLIAVGALLVMGVLDSIRLRILVRIGMRVGDALASRALRAMVATNSQTGSMTVRSGLRDIETVRNFIGSQNFASLMDMPFSALMLIVLYFLHPVFLIIVVAGGIVLVGLAIVNHRLTGAITAETLGLSLRANNFAEDGLRNSDVLEGMGMSSTFVERWRQHWFKQLRLSADVADLDARMAAASKSIRFLIQVVLMAAGAVLILGYEATGGIMLGATIIGSRALQPIEQAVGMWKIVIAVNVARYRISELLLKAPKREEGMPLPPPSGRLQVSSLHYAPQNTRKAILANLNFELAAGEALGIIGPSASGKSTLARLLVGAWPATAGAVRLDGADIYAWPRQDLMHFIGYLPQDVELFNGTIQDNIARMGEADPAAVVSAAQLAQAHQMILSFPKGYDTEIGENGYRLSAGQSQRIGLARAIHGKPRLVVLDEPYSNLDTAGEEALVQAIAALKKMHVTVIVISHRPSILIDMDKILALNVNGTMATFGSKGEVMAQYSKASTTARPSVTVVPLHGGAMEPAGSAIG